MINPEIDGNIVKIKSVLWKCIKNTDKCRFTGTQLYYEVNIFSVCVLCLLVNIVCNLNKN